jgi:hypothetical protein
MIRVTGGIIVLTLVLILQLVEEVRGDFRRQFPLGEIPSAVFVGMNAIVYIYCAIMIWLAVEGRPMAIPMAWGFATVMLLNGTGHLAIMVIRRRYFPGGITAPGLIAVSLYLMAQLVRG